MNMRAAFLLAALVFAGCQTAPEKKSMSATEIEFADAMKERLAYAPRIAWIKYQSGQPIADNAREVVILEELQAAGVKQGLDPVRVREFFSAQMAAFQTVQKEEINSWNAGDRPPNLEPMDLQTEIRPAIGKLNNKLIALLANPAVGHSAAFAGYCESVLRKVGFSAAASKQASAPIASDLPWKAP